MASLYGDALTVCRGGERATLIRVWTSLGGEEPTAMSWRVLVDSTLRSRVGVSRRLVGFLAFSSRGGDGPQPVDTRSFFVTVLGVSPSTIDKDS